MSHYDPDARFPPSGMTIKGALLSSILLFILPKSILKETLMLNAMRDGAYSTIIKFVFFGLLLMATGGMVFMDVGGFFRNGVGNNTVAKVAGQDISGPEFDQNVRRVLSRQGMAAKQAYDLGLIDRILGQEVNSMLLTQGALKNGIYISDDAVGKQINEMLAPAMKDRAGAKRKDVLRQLLQQQGMSEQDLIGTIRQSMTSTVLQAALQSGTTSVPRQEALDIYRVQNESRTVEGFFLPNNTVKGVPEANDAVLKAFYEAGKDSKYAIPETRMFTMAILGEDNVKSSINIPDEDLKKEYDRAAATYASPEQRVVQQAVADKEETAKQIMEAVKSGKSLKDASKAVTGKDTTYMGEQTYVKAGLTKAISDAAFAAAVDQPVGPVKTALGYHVLLVKKIIPADKKSFESVKEQIRKELVQTKLSQQMLNTANSIDDRLAAGDDLDKVAREMNLKIEKIGPVGREGATPDKHDAFKDYPKDRAYILKSAFEMNEGESAPVMQLSDGRYAAIHMDKIKPRTYQSFESVREELKKSWTADQQASLNHNRAAMAQQLIAGGQKTLPGLAAEMQVSVTTLKDLKHVGEPPQNIGKQGLDALFDAGLGETVMAPVPDGYLIGTIKAIENPDPSKVSDKDLKPIMDSLKKNSGDDIMMAYIKYLQDTLGVKVNRNLLNLMYGQESAGSESDPG
jgi:peptidyl-prolyl cis-trans isomerase D